MMIHNVEQRSDEWYALRMGIPTASEFSKALTPKKGELSTQAPAYACKLALELHRNEPCKDFIDNEWMERGRNLEEAAFNEYTFYHDTNTSKVGFIFDDKGRGCSPDFLIGDNGMGEIKCLKEENHVLALYEISTQGIFDSKYMPQVQGQMLIAERKWCDLVFYCPGLPLSVIRVHADEQYQAALDVALDTIIHHRDAALGLLNSNDVIRYKELENAA